MAATYNFKQIPIVLSAKDFLDVILSKTQRKTPTVVHPGYKISRIRQFYMRKVKFTQVTIHDKLSALLQEFPKVDEVHPFYGDLMNVLYDRDHYKVALGHLSTARRVVDKISNDFVKLLKFGDSLYRCKQLKRAALGRMATMVKKLAGALGYLEEVRKHLSRIPSIDPNTRTLLVAGFPNVGKSSFINKISRADVEVQPYAFTTQSLFVGHTDYRYLRFQVIDTPGVLDRSLEERGTIEMQSITALAHLKACILYFMDLSGQCGYPLDQQIALFNNIKPLFTGKPLVVAVNKADLCTIESLDAEDRQKLEDMVADVEDVKIMQLSVLKDDGVASLKCLACDMLLNHHTEKKQPQRSFESLMEQVYVAKPGVRDEKERGTSIPDSVNAAIASGSWPLTEDQKAERVANKKVVEMMMDVEEPNSLVNLDLRVKWDLEDDDWKYDTIPEIMDGKNIADWIDPDIEQRLKELEEEEELLLQEEAEERAAHKDDYQLPDEAKTLVRKIKGQIAVGKLESVTKRSRSHDRPKTAQQEAAIAKFQETIGRKRSRSPGGGVENRSASPAARSPSRKAARINEPKPGSGAASQVAAVRQRNLVKAQQFLRNKQAKKGEADHHVPDLKPKHLFSGTRGMGKTDRR